MATRELYRTQDAYDMNIPLFVNMFQPSSSVCDRYILHNITGDNQIYEYRTNQMKTLSEEEPIIMCTLSRILLILFALF